MKRLLVVLLGLFSVVCFASPIGYVTETTLDPTHFWLIASNTSPDPFGVVWRVQDLGGHWQDIGFGMDTPVIPGNSQGTGFGGFATYGSWYALISTTEESWTMSGTFAPVGESIVFSIGTPTSPPDPPQPPQAPEPCTVVLLSFGLVSVRLIRSAVR